MRTGGYLGHLTDGLGEFDSGSFIRNMFQVAQRTMRSLFSTALQENIQTNVR